MMNNITASCSQSNIHLVFVGLINQITAMQKVKSDFLLPNIKVDSSYHPPCEPGCVTTKEKIKAPLGQGTVRKKG